MGGQVSFQAVHVAGGGSRYSESDPRSESEGSATTTCEGGPAESLVVLSLRSDPIGGRMPPRRIERRCSPRNLRGTTRPGPAKYAPSPRGRFGIEG